jgi:ribonuclease P protein component
LSSSNNTSFRFGKNEKLKSKKAIDALFAKKQRFLQMPFSVFYQFGPMETQHAGVPVHAGVSVSARLFKHAVDRNRIKRLMREAYRLQKNELAAALLEKQLHLTVFFLHIDRNQLAFDNAMGTMKKVLQKLKTLSNEALVTSA